MYYFVKKNIGQKINQLVFFGLLINPNPVIKQMHSVKHLQSWKCELFEALQREWSSTDINFT